MLSERLKAMLEPVIESLGYELVLLEYSAHKGGGTLRLFIDSPGGVGLDDCTLVSREVSGVLDVEDPIPQGYRLEVSSPGLDRPLVKPAHFERFAGEDVKLTLAVPRSGRRRYAGRLVGMEDGRVVVQTTDQGRQSFAIDEIERAHLVPHFE